MATEIPTFNVSDASLIHIPRSLQKCILKLSLMKFQTSDLDE